MIRPETTAPDFFSLDVDVDDDERRSNVRDWPLLWRRKNRREALRLVGFVPIVGLRAPCSSFTKVKLMSGSLFTQAVSDPVSDVSRLHRPNVTELIGYCSEHGQNLLVYEFLKNGSLYDFLHLSDEYNKPIISNNRVKIALGIARALEYLHEVCLPYVVHKNI